MTKFLAIVKREYVQRVRTKLFVIMTILGPVLLMVFTVVPTMLMSVKTEDTRLAVIDQTEGAKLFPAVQGTLMKTERPRDKNAKVEIVDAVNDNTQQRMEKAGQNFNGGFVVTYVEGRNRPLEDLKRELNGRIGKGELEGYLIIPPDIMLNSNVKHIYYCRNLSDLPSQSQIERALNDAVRKQRLTAAGVSEEALERLSQRVDLEVYPVNEKGEEGARGSGIAGFALPFILAFLIYITVLLYGQVVLGAVVEEKETRIAEILFSSVKSFTLMLGKLIGVSLVALTQLGIWVLAFGALTVVGANALR